MLLSFRNLPISHFRIAAARPIVIAVPNVLSAAFFLLTRRQNLIKFFREVFPPMESLAPTSKLGHLRKAEEGQALVLAA